MALFSTMVTVTLGFVGAPFQSSHLRSFPDDKCDFSNSPLRGRVLLTPDQKKSLHRTFTCDVMTKKITFSSPRPIFSQLAGLESLYTLPHGYQRNTVQTRTCGRCHHNRIVSGIATMSTMHTRTESSQRGLRVRTRASTRAQTETAGTL